MKIVERKKQSSDFGIDSVVLQREKSDHIITKGQNKNSSHLIKGKEKKHAPLFLFSFPSFLQQQPEISDFPKLELIDNTYQ